MYVQYVFIYKIIYLNHVFLCVNELDFGGWVVNNPNIFYVVVVSNIKPPINIQDKSENNIHLKGTIGNTCTSIKRITYSVAVDKYFYIRSTLLE